MLVKWLTTLLSFSSLEASWHEKKAEGWAWYQEEKKRIEEVETPSTPSEVIGEAREELENKLSQAMLEPSEKNMLAYMEAQKRAVDQSVAFAMAWNRVLVNHPHLDTTVTDRPVSQYGLKWYEEQEMMERERCIESLSDRYGLFFFYEGNSKISAVAAQVVIALEKKYSFELFPISTDGEVLAPWPEHFDNGISTQFQIPLYPALYLVDPKENEAIPIGFGLMALDQIERNIMAQFKEKMVVSN